MNREQLKKLLEGFSIPAQPRVLVEIQKERQKPEPSLPAIAKLISEDVGLSAAVLKTINSPFFGMRRNIESISQAVMLLGLANITNLVVCYSLRNSIKGKCSISLERFWDSATDVAGISAAIAKQLGLPVSADEAYMMGLFMDCGIPVMACRFEDYKQVLIDANADNEREMTVIEDQFYKTNHAVIGYLTSRSWGLPEHIRKAILSHHDSVTHFKPSSDDIILQRDYMIAVHAMAENISHSFRRLSEHLEWERSKQVVLDFIGSDESEYMELRADIHEMLRSA